MVKNRLGIITTALYSLLFFISKDVHALSEGYILTGAYGGTNTVLLDSLGNVAYKWDHSNLLNPKSGYSCYLLKNGNLLRSAIVPDNTVAASYAPAQGIVQEIDPAGNIVWSFTYANNDSGMIHHDIKPMSNGHFLAVAFVPLTKSQMITAGIDTVLLKGMTGSKFILSEKIIEVDPRADGGPKIVWEWKMQDHIIPDAQAAQHPELIGGSIVKAPYYTNQWVHLNGLDYNEELDMILFSSRVFSELFMIDHGTTTQQAAAHTGGKRNKGGDLLFRWGNPANYKASGATTISVLHCVNWIPQGYPGAGGVIFFHNNAAASTGPNPVATQLSQVIEIKPPMDVQGNFSITSGQPFGPTEPTWIFAPTDTFFSSFAMSSAFRLPNGNTIAHLAYPPSGNSFGGTGSSIIVEINKDKKIVWKYTLELKSGNTDPFASAFNPAKIMYYSKDYAGVMALPGVSTVQHPNVNGSIRSAFGIQKVPGLIKFSNVEGCKICIYNMLGVAVTSATSTGNQLSLPTGSLPSGVYNVKVISKNKMTQNATYSITN
jgi:hypothetical protein